MHVPAYNEPPDMLIETLDALARLDYPDFEVLVIDNNTKDEAVWRPVERTAPSWVALPLLPRGAARGLQGRRAQLRPERTVRDAEIVAVIDSDYIVESNWLRDLTPLLPGPAHRDRAGAAGLPRRGPERLQGHVLRGVPRLLPHRHDHAQRAQRHHPARHHDHGAPHPAWTTAAGRNGPSPRTPSSACASSSAASMPPMCRTATAAG